MSGLSRPSFQFRGTETNGMFVPYELLDRGTRGEITYKELLLLLLVYRLSRDDRGCWATNEYIGESLGLHPVEVSRRIRKLSGKEVKQTEDGPVKTLPGTPPLFVVQHNGQRYLEVCWRRTPLDVEQLDPEYAKAYKTAYCTAYGEQFCGEEHQAENNLNPLKQKVKGGKENLSGSRKENLNQSNIRYKDEKNTLADSVGSRVCDTSNTNGAPATNGSNNKHRHIAEKTSPPSVGRNGESNGSDKGISPATGEASPARVGRNGGKEGSAATNGEAARHVPGNGRSNRLRREKDGAFPVEKVGKGYTDQDYARAQKLCDAIAETGNLCSHPVLTNWAREFASLANCVPDPQLIDGLLDWYCRALRDDLDFLPEVFCARSFRQKFVSVKSARRRVMKEARRREKSKNQQSYSNGW